MADRDLLAELDALGDSQQSQASEPAPSPPAEDGAGSSPLSRELEDEGYFRDLANRFARDRAERDQAAIDRSQGWSASSITNAVQGFFSRSGDEFRRGIVAPLREENRPGGFLGEAGRLTPEQRRLAAEAEAETASWTAPASRAAAEAMPQVSPDVRGPGLMVPGAIFRGMRGLFEANANRQEERLRRAQAMVSGEAAPPQYAEWRSLVDNGTATIANMFTSLPIQYAGIINGYAPSVGSNIAAGTPFQTPEFQDNDLYRFGQAVQRSVEQAFPGDRTRQFEFSHSLVQGLASTMAFGGQGVIAQVLGAGPRGQLALIALSGMAAQVPDEFQRVTQAMERGDARERDRIIAVLANSVLGATEAMPFANTIAGNARGWRGRLARGGEQAFEETVQEGVQQSGQNITRGLTYDPNQDPYEGVLESMVVAAISGFGYGAAFSGGHGAAAVQPPPAAAPGSAPVVQARAGGGRTGGTTTSPAPEAAPSPTPSPDTTPTPSPAPAATPQGEGVDNPFGLPVAPPEAEVSGDRGRGPGEEEARPAEEELGRVAAMADREPGIPRRPAAELEDAANAVEAIDPVQARRLRALAREIAALPAPDGRPSSLTAPAAEETEGAAPAQREEGRSAAAQEQAVSRPNLQERLAAVRPEVETAEQTADIEALVDQNLPVYYADMEDVRNRRNITTPLSDDQVRAVARHMARGNLTAEEALERYAVEQYEAERQTSEAAGTPAQAPRGAEQAQRQAEGAAAATPAAAQPAARAADRNAAGARTDGRGPAGLGTAGAGPGTAAAAQQPGSAQRQLQPTTNHRIQFRGLLASKRPIKWAAVGKQLSATPEQVQVLQNEALAEGLLRKDRNGVMRRTVLAQPAPTTRTALQDSLSVPPDVAIESRARFLQITPSPTVQAHAVAIEAARGSPAFADVLRAAKRDKVLKVQDVRDLNELVGFRLRGKPSKAEAFASIEKRHQEYLAFLERRTTTLGAFSSDNGDGRSQRADLDRLGFYSGALEAMKGWKQGKGTGEQILAHLKASGVKEAEVEATHLKEFLGRETAAQAGTAERPSSRELSVAEAIASANREEGRSAAAARQTISRPKNKIFSREEVVAFLERNRVEVREARYGGEERDFRVQYAPVQRSLDDENVLTRNVSAGDQQYTAYYDTDAGNVWVEEDATGNQIPVPGRANNQTWDDAYAAVERHVMGRQVPEDAVGPAKWSQYSLDPSNYRETVMHLPVEATEPRAREMQARRDQLQREMVEIEGRHRGSGRELRLIPAHAERAQEFNQLGEQLARSAFKQDHFSSEPNVIAHARTFLARDADGKITFVIDEAQSDWGQKLRDGGVRDEAKIKELERASQAAKKQLDETQSALAAAAERLGVDRDELLDHKHAGGPEIDALYLADKGAIAESVRIDAELRTAQTEAVGHPLVNTTDQWTTTAFRRLITQAVEAGAERIAIVPAIVQYSPPRNFGTEKGMIATYDGIYPRNLYAALQHVVRDWYAGSLYGAGTRYNDLDAKQKQAVNAKIKEEKAFDAISQEEMPLTSSLDGRTFAQDTGGRAGETSLEAANRRADRRGLAPIQFHTFPLSDKVKEQAPSGQALFSLSSSERPPAGYPVGEAVARRAVEYAVGLGHSVTVDKNVAQAVFKAAEPIMHLVPPGYRVGSAFKIEPGPNAETVRVHIEYSDGGVTSRQFFWSQIKGSRALHLGREPGEPKVLLAVRFVLPSDSVPFASGQVGSAVGSFEKSVRGELVHEAFHASVEAIPQALGLRILNHAHSLRVFDVSAYDYLMAIGREDLAVRMTDVSISLGLSYWNNYHAMFGSPVAANVALLEEEGAHMVELAYHGEIAADKLAPIMADLEVALPGIGEVIGQNQRDRTLLAVASAPLREEFSRRIPEVYEAVRRELSRMLPGDAPVRLEDRLFHQGLALDEMVTSPQRSQSMGLGLKWAMGLSMAIDPATMKQKGFHGLAAHILHAYGNGGLYTNDEWRLLVERAEKTGAREDLERRRVPDGSMSLWEAYTKTYAQYGPKGQAVGLEEELVGVLAENWAKGTSYGRRVDSLLARIVKFFEAIRNAIRGLGFETADDVFQRVASGEIASRAEGGRQEPRFEPFPYVPSPEEVHLSSEEGREAIALLGGVSPGAMMAISDANSFRQEMRAIAQEMGAQGKTKAEVAAAVRAARLEQFVALREQGLRDSEIADILGVAPTTLANLVRDNPEIARRSSRWEAQRFWVANDPKVVSLFDAGSTVGEIAQQIGVAKDVIRERLRVNGINRAAGAKPAETIERVAELRREGRSLTSIAEEVDLTKGQVDWILRNLRNQGVALAAFSSAPPAPQSRSFSIPGFDGSVSERIKDTGERLRTYRVGELGREIDEQAAPAERPSSPDEIAATDAQGEEGLPTGAADASISRPNRSSFILSEQSDGSWELTFFNPQQEHLTQISNLVSSIESDLGNRLSPKGWLTPQAYGTWRSSQPDLVKYHQDAGPLFGGMYASPRAVEFAQAILDQAYAETTYREFRERADAALKAYARARPTSPLNFLTSWTAFLDALELRWREPSQRVEQADQLREEWKRLERRAGVAD